MTESGLKKLLFSVVEAYEKTYFDAMILWNLMKVHEFPNLEERVKFFRHDQKLFDIAHSRFQPLYDLLETEVDEEGLRKALSGIPSPKKPN